GFSGTRCANDRNNFTGGNGQVDVCQNLAGGTVGTESTTNVLAGHGRGQYRLRHSGVTPSTLGGSTFPKVVAATSTSQVSQSLWMVTGPSIDTSATKMEIAPVTCLTPGFGLGSFRDSCKHPIASIRSRSNTGGNPEKEQRTDAPPDSKNQPWLPVQRRWHAR